MYLVGDLEVRYMHRRLHESGKYVTAYDGMIHAVKLGVPIHFKAHFGSPSRTELSLSFADSIWRLSPMECLTVFEGMTRLEPTPERPYRRYDPHVLREIRTDSTFKPGFIAQMKEFVEGLIPSNFTVRSGCTLAEAYRVTELCEQIAMRR